jgi:hypothetical protein
MIGEDLVSEIASREPPVLPTLRPPALSASEILRARSRAPTADPMDVARNVLQLTDNPSLMMDMLDAVGDDLDESAPMTAQDMRDTTSRAVFFLASKAPKEKPSAPGMPPLPPPRQDVLRFQRYLKAIDDPTSILDEADEGTLSPEIVEAVKTVYPQLFQMIQADLAARIENMPRVPYRKRTQISALLGQDMTGTLNPQIGMMAQSAYGNAPQEQPQQQLKSFQGKALKTDARATRETTEWRKAQDGVGSWNRIGRRTG